jgi:nucleoside-diphosphate-sugar epimerase
LLDTGVGVDNRRCQGETIQMTANAGAIAPESFTPLNFFLAGGTRGVGWEIAQQLRQAGHAVATLVRPGTDPEPLQQIGARILGVDALAVSQVAAAMTCFGPSPFTVISTIGGTGQAGDQPRSDGVGNCNLIAAAQGLPCQRFVLVSSIGSGNSRNALPASVLDALNAALVEKETAEKTLMDSSLPYTIIRPGGLVSEPPTGNGVLSADPLVAGTITRADVATLVIAASQSDAAVNQIFSAVDRDRLRSPQAVDPVVL